MHIPCPILLQLVSDGFIIPGVDPGPQGGGGAKINNRVQSVREIFGHAHFNETTPTYLPRTRQMASGTRLFHSTNRFLVGKYMSDQSFLAGGGC